MGAFSHKFSIAPIGETTDPIKKNVTGWKKCMQLLHHHTKYGGDRGSRAGCKPKSVMFLPADLREAQPCRYCFYSGLQKWVTDDTLVAIRSPDKSEF